MFIFCYIIKINLFTFVLNFKTFQDNRTKTKTKQSMIRADMRKTGQNSPCSILTVVENDTLELINPTSISGHTSSNASKACFDFEDEPDLGAQLDDNIVTVGLHEIWQQEKNSDLFGTSSPHLPIPSENLNISSISSISSIKDPTKSMF